jgi:hypothetical protein
MRKLRCKSHVINVGDRVGNLSANKWEIKQKLRKDKLREC